MEGAKVEAVIPTISNVCEFKGKCWKWDALSQLYKNPFTRYLDKI
jgi:hypothetical protein